MLSKTVFEIEAGRAKREKQNDAEATYAPKIEKEDCKVDFSLDARAVSARIRGVTPIPGAFAYLNEKMIKICRVSVLDKTASGAEIGEVVDLDSSGDGSISVACKSGILLIRSLKPEGKGVMSAGDFVRGRKIQKGDVFK